MLTYTFLQHHRKLIRLIPAFLVAVVPACAQYGLALSPMRVEANVAPGAQRSGTLTVGNDEKVPGRFRVEILDMSIDQEAVPQFEKDISSENAFSCKQWLTVNPMEADIAALGKTVIRYTFRIPANAEPKTYHCALGFTALPDISSGQGAIGIVSLVRLTTTFYITVGNPEPAGEMNEISLEKCAAHNTPGCRAVIQVKNSGFTNLRGEGKIEVVNEAGEVVQACDFPPVVILPDRTQRLPLSLSSKVNQGGYTLRIHVDLGTGEIQEADLKFQFE